MTDYTKYDLTVTDRLKYGSLGAALAAAVSLAYYRSIAAALILCPVFAVGSPYLMRKKLKEQRDGKLSEEFLEAAGILAGYLNAGISSDNAFLMTYEQLKERYGEKQMIVREFGRLAKGILINRPAAEMLSDFGRRTGNRDIQSFAEVYGIAGKTGGDLGKIIERTRTVLRDRMQVAEEIRNVTASRRFEQRIMNFVPCGVILYLNVASPGFMDVMYETLMGRAVMTGCLLASILSYIISEKILDIKI